MTRRPGQSRHFILIPLIILILLTCAGPVMAGSIYVFDGNARSDFDFLFGNLTGERGFTLDQFGQVSPANVSSAFGGCGQVIHEEKSLETLVAEILEPAAGKGRP